jgi:hypothetical protein
MNEHLPDYTSFIQECRTAAANGHLSMVIPIDRHSDVESPFPSTATDEAPQYLYIPWPQIQIMARTQLFGIAPYIYLMVWRQCLLRKSLTVSLTSEALFGFAFSRYQIQRALACLERAGLLRVERHRGRKPLVTLKVDTPPWKHKKRKERST